MRSLPSSLADDRRDACRIGPPLKEVMTTLEVKLDLPDRLARESQAAGPLMCVRHGEAMQRRAAQTLLDGAARGSHTRAKPRSKKDIQAEVSAVRRERWTHGAAAEWCHAAAVVLGHDAGGDHAAHIEARDPGNLRPAG